MSDLKCCMGSFGCFLWSHLTAGYGFNSMIHFCICESCEMLQVQMKETILRTKYRIAFSNMSLSREVGTSVLENIFHDCFIPHLILVFFVIPNKEIFRLFWNLLFISGVSRISPLKISLFVHKQSALQFNKCCSSLVLIVLNSFHWCKISND